MHRACNTQVYIVSDATFTFRVDEDLKDQFAKAAKSSDLTGAQLLRGFMRDFVRRHAEEAEHDAWFRRQVEIGLAAADAGELVAAEDVEAEFAARRAETRSRLDRKS
jgi:predicted transcriptional regulator